MHDSVLKWFAETLAIEDIQGRRVLEVGSYDVNGSVRPTVEALEPRIYVGVDQSEGPRVDVVCKATDLAARFGSKSFDVVISTEMLEHVEDWRPVMTNMVDVLGDGGWMYLTTRGPGFPYHPYPIDRWRYTVDAMADILDRCGLEPIVVTPDPQAAGVFAIAHKPTGWTAPWRTGLFDGVAVERMAEDPR